MYDDSAKLYLRISKQCVRMLLRAKGCTVVLNRLVHTQACILSVVNVSMRLDFPFSTPKVFSDIFSK